jgi:3-deoxy-D-manno-octulosonate 8-phosphate phosphatase (KDO 8-P phosphatase)
MITPVIRAGAREKAARVKLLLLDVDGVLTDGRLVYDAAGQELKIFHVRDGQGIKLLIQAGIEVGILSGRRSHVVEVRARELGIRLVQQQVRDKVAAWRQVLEERGLTPADTAYVGDDLPDVLLLRKVGFAAAVGDAIPEAIEAAHYVAGQPGGKGAIREISEFLLRARGAWEAATKDFLLD